jgi:type III secretory pathway component EscT
MDEVHPLLAYFVRALDAGATDLGAWAVAWARVMPAVVLVPAFGLRAISLPVRVALGLVIALSVAPVLRPAATAAGYWLLLLLEQALRGLPVALVAAAALWSATMAGGLIDNLRDARERSDVPTVEASATPTGVLLSMLVAIAFLSTGGPARVAAALGRPELAVVGPLTRAVHTLASAVELAVAVAAPVVVAAVLFEVASALATRTAGAVTVPFLLAPIRSVALLGVAALVLERMVHLLALASRVPL